MCISNAANNSSTPYRSSHLRRCSYMPTCQSGKPPERYRASSLVVPNQSSSLLRPLSGSRREFSLESGYLSSHDCGESTSTPNSPKKFMLSRETKAGKILSQSYSEEDGSCSPSTSHKAKLDHFGEVRPYISAREKRQLFHK